MWVGYCFYSCVLGGVSSDGRMIEFVTRRANAYEVLRHQIKLGYKVMGGSRSMIIV